jgi:hypothetical protein
VGRVFVVNVGVNASHRLVSPLYDDGSFTFVTILEERSLQGASLVRYGDVPRLRMTVPERYWAWPTHYDPEFESLTYGDNCGWAPRAAALRSARPGDALLFIARLVRIGSGEPVFGLVGLLEVESVRPNVRSCPPDARLRGNAHVRRALADPRYWDGFWLFAGTPRSGLFPRAALVGRAEAELLFRDKDGAPWQWRDGRSELQTIGSYTRSCRCVIDPALDPQRARLLWDWLAQQVAPQVPLGDEE